jgi:hypothetical protein
MSKLTRLLTIGTAMALMLSAAPSALAAAASTQAPETKPVVALHAGMSGKIRGMVPAARGPAGFPHRPKPVDLAGTNFASTGNLSYFGGPVMRSNSTYAIYWEPAGSTVSANYSTLINGFLANVAAVSGATTNVYSSDTQYYDGSGPIAYSSSFGGSYIDTSTPIPDDCSGQYASSGVTVSGCVTDADIQAEVSRAITANGWTPGPTTEFFLFTPRNVGSCLTSSSTTCAYTYYCAYHSNYLDGSSRQVLYANQPYTDTTGVGAPGACDSEQHPNGDWADATISVLSHEHNESITDPFGNAWHDSSGNENGDKCAWNFGAALGSTAYGQYNQQIGTGRYYLQQEWSNDSSSCVLAYASTAPVVSSFTPGSGAVKTTVTISGANFTGATAVKFNGISATFSVKSSSTITTSVPKSATSGPITVITAKGTTTSASWFWVSPTITGLSSTSGKVGAVIAISGTNFTGASSVKFNGVAASFSVTSATKISATVPSGATTGHLTVTTPAGTVSSSRSFTVLA